MTTKARLRSRNTLFVLAVATTLFVLPAIASACDNEIRIAPRTLNLRSGGTVVTVHTDVPYSHVDVYTVFLAGVAISSWKADDRGYFVAKFQMDDIKRIDGLILDGFNTFQFVAETVDGDAICGEAEVKIIDRGSRADGAKPGSATE